MKDTRDRRQEKREYYRKNRERILQKNREVNKRNYDKKMEEIRQNPNGIVYLIHCLTNNKRYIGSSKNPLEHRIHKHFFCNRPMKNPLYGDIDLYGRENFIYGIVEENIPLQDLTDRETHWIRLYNGDYDLYNIRRV